MAIEIVDFSMKHGDFPISFLCVYQRVSSNTHSFWVVPSGKRLHNCGTLPCLIGKSTINGQCSIAILNYQRVKIRGSFVLWAKLMPPDLFGTMMRPPAAIRNFRRKP